MGTTFSTVYKYHQQWNASPDLEQSLCYFRWIFHPKAPDYEKSKEVTAIIFGMSKEQLEDILYKPYGLRRLLSNKIFSPAHAEAAHKRHIALELALLIADHLTKDGGKLEDVYLAIKRFMKECQKNRVEAEEHVKEDNKTVSLMKEIIEADLELEARRGNNPERLSREEIDTIFRWGKQQAAKELEVMYWIRIARIVAEGNSVEEAREIMYQDVLSKNNVEAAKAFRQYQDMIHPVKGDDRQVPPATA